MFIPSPPYHQGLGIRETALHLEPTILAMDAQTTTVLLSSQISTSEDLENVSQLISDIEDTGRRIGVRIILTPTDDQPTVTIEMTTPNINHTFMTVTLSEALNNNFQIQIYAVIILV